MTSKKHPRTRRQKIALFIIIAIFLILTGLATWLFWEYYHGKTPEISTNPQPEFPEPVYSTLTGEEIDSDDLNNSPTYCIQIPNGLDGRPQAGLNQAGVVFEAIAEAGITRFAAVFQNPTSSAIGPIRSLRPYYLDWDLPFDCAIIHQGGSTEALIALHSSGALELEEDDRYTWRETTTLRNWNNLFTSSANLTNFSRDLQQTSSNLQAFPRLTPDEVSELLLARNSCEPATEDLATEESATDPCQELISPIIFHISNVANYDPIYTYNHTTNSYDRSYADGTAHFVYDCPSDLVNPITTNDCGELVQISPSAVIAMFVSESKMPDNYHEQITTIGQGRALIFQNGTVIDGTWSKSSARAQITFRNDAGEVIKFTPGPLWISAIPAYGSVIY